MNDVGVPLLVALITIFIYAVNVLLYFVRMFSNDSRAAQDLINSKVQAVSVPTDDLILQLLQTNGAGDLNIIACVPRKIVLIRATSMQANPDRFFAGAFSIVLLAGVSVAAMILITEQTLGRAALIWIILILGPTLILTFHFMRNSYLLFVVNPWFLLSKTGTFGVLEALPSRVPAPEICTTGWQIDETEWRAELWLKIDYKLASGPVYETLEEAQNHYMELAGILAQLGEGNVQKAHVLLFPHEIFLKRLWRRLTGRSIGR